MDGWDRIVQGHKVPACLPARSISLGDHDVVAQEFEKGRAQKKDKHAKHILGVFWMGERDRIGGIRSCFSRSLFSKPESSFVLLGGCMYFLALHGWLGSGGHGRGWWVVKKEFEI